MIGLPNGQCVPVGPGGSLDRPSPLGIGLVDRLSRRAGLASPLRLYLPLATVLILVLQPVTGSLPKFALSRARELDADLRP